MNKTDSARFLAQILGAIMKKFPDKIVVLTEKEIEDTSPTEITMLYDKPNRKIAIGVEPNETVNCSNEA